MDQEVGGQRDFWGIIRARKRGELQGQRGQKRATAMGEGTRGVFRSTWRGLPTSLR